MANIYNAVFIISQERPGAPVAEGEPGVSRRDLWLTRVVHLEPNAPPPDATFVWEFLDKPSGSAVAFLDETTGGATQTSARVKFTPDVWGTYRIRLIINKGQYSQVQLAAAVLTNTGAVMNRGWRLPAFKEIDTEGNFPGQERGYADDWDTIILDILEHGFGGGGGGTGLPTATLHSHLEGNADGSWLQNTTGITMPDVPTATIGFDSVNTSPRGEGQILKIVGQGAAADGLDDAGFGGDVYIFGGAVAPAENTFRAGSVRIVGGRNDGNGGESSTGGDVEISGGASSTIGGSVYLDGGDSSYSSKILIGSRVDSLIGIGKASYGAAMYIANNIVSFGAATQVQLPLDFQIGTTAVGPTVTAPNLTELTDGSETALHSHAGGGAPSTHATTHEPGGVDALAVDAAAAIGSLRTLGTSATSACAGNDARLSDNRVASGLATTSTTVVNVSDATAPVAGQALVATSSTHATWQSISGLPEAVGQYSHLEGNLDGSWAQNTEGIFLSSRADNRTTPALIGFSTFAATNGRGISVVGQASNSTGGSVLVHGGASDDIESGVGGIVDIQGGQGGLTGGNVLVDAGVTTGFAGIFIGTRTNNHIYLGRGTSGGAPALILSPGASDSPTVVHCGVEGSIDLPGGVATHRFQIQGAEVAASVTAANLNLLCGSAEITGLHTHPASSGGGSSYSCTFIHSTLTNGTLHVTHSLGRKYVVCEVYDDAGYKVIPDSVRVINTSTLEIDLSSFGTLTGTWAAVVVG